MSQKRDRLSGEDSLSHLGKTWFDVRESHMEIPTDFKWPHQWNDEWKQHKIICAKHFGLDLNKPENQSESINVHYIFVFAFSQTFLPVFLP